MAAKLYKASKTFWTADTHFWHATMITAGFRMYGSVEEMNEEIVANWNRLVGCDDTVFHLGDVSFGGSDRTLEILNRLNGKIILVRGNHDKVIRGKIADRFEDIVKYLEIDVVEGEIDVPRAQRIRQRIVMSHFPFRSWNRHHYGSWHLHGHCHGNIEPLGKSIDVGVDNFAMRPASYGRIKAIMSFRDIHENDHHTRKV